MKGRGESGDRGPKGPANSGRGNSGPPPGKGPPNQGRQGPPGGGPPRKPSGPKKRGGLRVKRLDGNAFELDHPKCVAEMELDYEEGMELYREGDVEAARDALRYALQGCGDNLWAHVALGNIALDAKDPKLAKGHFGYAVELAQRAIPPGFDGRLPRDRICNQPFHEALEGLAACYDALGNPFEAASLRQFSAELDGGRPRGAGGPKRPGPAGR